MPSENGPASRNGETVRYSEPTYKPPDSKVAVWTLFAAVIVAAIYLLQLRAMLDSNRINREALEAVQRAYITFSPAFDTTIKIDPFTHKANSWDFMIPMENSGVTPTRGMTAHIDQWNGHDKLPGNFSYPDTGNAAPQLLVLGPKAKTDLGPVSITPDVIDALESVPKGGSWHLYFYGWARYHDIFQATPEHITMFCYEVTSVTGDAYFPRRDEVATFFIACPHHNCTDEECMTDKKAN